MDCLCREVYGKSDVGFVERRGVWGRRFLGSGIAEEEVVGYGRVFVSFSISIICRFFFRVLF